MAEVKISALPAATTPLVGDELVEIVQGGANKKVAANELGGTATLQEDILYSDLVVKINAGTLVKGQQYKITDAAQNQISNLGIIVTATSVNSVSSSAIGGFLNADYEEEGNYSAISGYTLYNTSHKNAGVWTVAKESILINGNIVLWNNKHYKVVDATAFDGTDPSTNETSYLAIAKSVGNYGYTEAWDFIMYCLEDNYITQRVDDFCNSVTDSSYVPKNAIQRFQWGRKDCLNNIVATESYLDCQNAIGPVEGNVVINSSRVNLSGSLRYFSACTVQNGGNVDLTNANCNFGANAINGGQVIANDCTIPISGNVLTGEFSILNMQGATGTGDFTDNTLIKSQLTIPTFTGSISGLVFNSYPEYADNAAAIAGGVPIDGQYRVTGTGDIKVVI